MYSGTFGYERFKSRTIQVTNNNFEICLSRVTNTASGYEQMQGERERERERDRARLNVGNKQSRTVKTKVTSATNITYRYALA
jgi:hypothetical protein